MAIFLVSLIEAKEHLRIKHVDSDADIDQKIQQASAMTLRYMKFDAVPAEWFTGSPLEISAPYDVKGVTLGILGELFEGREASVINIDAIYNLLSILPRDPTLA